MYLSKAIFYSWNSHLLFCIFTCIAAAVTSYYLPNYRLPIVLHKFRIRFGHFYKYLFFFMLVFSERWKEIVHLRDDNCE